MKISFTPRIPQPNETYFGKKYAADPAAQARHDATMAKLREAVRDEVEALYESGRPTWEDLHGPTFY